MAQRSTTPQAVNTIERPDTVHGRLLEAVHISGYTFERACGELEWLLDDDRWQHVGRGFDDVNTFLATIDFSEFRIAIEQRKTLAKRLAAIQASQRATARLLGVDEGTIRNDLGKRGAENSAAAGRALSESTNNHDAPAENSAWFQTDIDPARDAKRDATRAAKEQEREARRDENRKKVADVTDPALGGAKFATIVIDPPWDWNDEGDVDQLGRARPTYETLTVDQIRTYPIPYLADVDCHCYLWITNRSLPKGFDLLTAWGFRYVTCLTWCKPSIGMGNYFRGSTEQVLFAVKGTQPLKRHDVGTWFEAPRGPSHSTKPAAFYELVEACSPGPYLDYWSRREPRAGWMTWGENSHA